MSPINPRHENFKDKDKLVKQSKRPLPQEVKGSLGRLT